MTIFIDGVEVGPVYGAISVDDAEVGQSLVDKALWYKIDQFDADGVALQTTPDHANDQITVLAPGVFAISFAFSFNDSANVTYHIAVYIDGVVDTMLKIQRRIGAGNDVGSATISGLRALGAGQVVDVRVNAGSDNKDFIMGHGNLTVHTVDR